jgi:hypothetical protein
MSKVMDGGRTHKYSTGDGNLAKKIIDIYKLFSFGG